MTASERRAAGEAEFCACPACVGYAVSELRRSLRPIEFAPFGWYNARSRDAAVAMLRALVVQALFTGWGEP